jgi:hypothetical protein
MSCAGRVTDRVGTIDPKLLLLRFPGRPRRRWSPLGEPVAGALPPSVPVVELPFRAGRAELDPVLAEHDPSRLLVSGSDADLAAVLVRLLRTDRLHVEVAYLAARRSPATAAWGLPTGSAAAAAALDAPASQVPLIRDDSGGVLVGRGEIRGLRGECYCDETLVLRGAAPWLVVAPSPAGGLAVRAGRLGRRPDGRTRPVPAAAPSGRGSAVGRAVQVGCEPATVLLDGVAHPRPVRRWSWYRHTGDWLLVRTR